MAKKPTQKSQQPKPVATPKVDSKGIKAIEEFNKNILDAQKKQIKSQQSLSDITDSLKDSWDGLSSAIKSIDSLSEKLGGNFDDIVDLTKTINSNLENVGTELYEELDVTAKIKKINDDRSKQLSQSKDLKKDINKLDSDSHDTEKALKKIQADQLRILQEQESLSGSSVGFLANQTAEKRAQLALELESAKKSEESLSNQLAELKAKREEATLAKSTLESEIAAGAAMKEALTALEQTAVVLDKANAKAKELGISVNDMSDKLVEPFKNAVSFLDSVPGGDLISKAFGLDSIMDKVKKNVTASFTESLAATGSVGKASFAALRTGAMSFMTTLLPILPILLAVAAAAMAIKKAFEMDQEVTDMARNLGMSKEEAQGIHSELLEVAEDTKVVGANTEALGAAYQELAKSMGVSKLASTEMAETQVYLTKQMGMAGEEAAAFQKMSMAGGKSSYQNLAVIEAGVKSMTGGMMNYKEVAKDIATSSKAVQASYKGNIAALTKAVVTAKKFGMTLDDTKKSADSILDIESSLEKEMTANVLTGKNMNLNLARELALRGDTAGAMDEMMKQAGGYDDLMKMAPYQQKAVAEAMGMTTEEMIKAAEHQKNLNTMSKELGITLDENGKMSEEEMARAMASNNEEAKKLAMQQQQNSAAEKLAALGDKLMVIFAKIAEPIMEMLDPLMEMVEVLFPALEVVMSIAFAPLKWAFQLLSSIIKGVGKVGKFLGGLFGGGDDKSKEASLADDAENAKGSEGTGSKEDIVASGGGAAIGVEDALIRPGQPPVTFDKGDLIMAGTNLLGETSENSASTSTAPTSTNQNSGMSEMISLLKELIAKVDQPVKITIGSKAIDEIESQTSMKRSFTTKADRSYGTFS